MLKFRQLSHNFCEFCAVYETSVFSKDKFHMSNIHSIYDAPAVVSLPCGNPDAQPDNFSLHTRHSATRLSRPKTTNLFSVGAILTAVAFVLPQAAEAQARKPAVKLPAKRQGKSKSSPTIVGRTPVVIGKTPKSAVTPYVPGELIVKFSVSTTSAPAYQAHARARGKVKHSFRYGGYQQVALPQGMSIAQGIALYRAMPGVEAVQPNFRYRLLRKPNDPKFDGQYGTKKIKAPRAWDTTVGSQDIVVAVLDSGINYRHEDLAANMFRNVDRTGANGEAIEGERPGNGIDDDDNGFVDDIFGIDAVNDDSDPFDDNNHGTNCAGIIGAVGSNRRGITGVNWQVRMMAIKVADAEGGLTGADILEGLQYVIMMRNERGVNVRVINSSFGGLLPPGTDVEDDPALRDAFQLAGESGIVNAAAAGNDARDNDAGFAIPANFEDSADSIIVAAASNANDRLTDFSNFGEGTVDLAAPGRNILTTALFTKTGKISNSAYSRVDGTSFASPYVAGAAALMLSVRPNLTPRQVKAVMLASVDKLKNLQGKVVSGGRLNVDRAVANALIPPDNGGGDGGDGGGGDDGDGGGGGGGGGGDPVTPPNGGGTPLTNGDIVFTEENFVNANLKFFATISRIGANGGGQTILVGGIRDFQNPYISLRSGRVAFVADLANVDQPGRNNSVEVFGNASTQVVPEQEIFVLETSGGNAGTATRITNDEANGIPPVSDRDPAISPDGRRIVFVRRNPTTGTDDIFIASAQRDPTRPGGTPQMFLLVTDDPLSGRTSNERRPSWSPDGTRIVFQSDRGLAAGDNDFDIYAVNVPATFTGTTARPTPVQLTSSPGDDVEPSVGPGVDESRVLRPNGQLVYASNRDDGRVEDETVTSSRGPFTYRPGEDFDIYLQDLSLENTTTNRATRIVDSPREVDLVLEGTGDRPQNFGNSFAGIERKEPAAADDELREEYNTR